MPEQQIYRIELWINGKKVGEAWSLLPDMLDDLKMKWLQLYATIPGNTVVIKEFYDDPGEKPN